MDGVGAGLSRGAHVLCGVEIRGDLDERVGRGGMQRALVVRRRDRDRLDALGAAGAEDPQRDLSPVGYQQAAHEGESRLRLAERSGRLGGVGSTLPRLTRHEGGIAVCG